MLHERGEEVGVDARFQPVRRKGAEPDTDEGGYRAEREEKAVHTINAPAITHA